MEGLASALLPIAPVLWTNLPLALLLKLWTAPVPVLFLSPPVVVAYGLDGDERVADKTDRTDGSRILELWNDEHDLRSMWLVVRLRALLMTMQFANLVTAKFRRSDWRSWCGGLEALLAAGFMSLWRKNWSLATRFYEELHLWVRAHELVDCYDQLNLAGNASLEHVAGVIQSDSASVDWSKQKVFVTSLRAGDCNADSMRSHVARRDKKERELNPGKRQQQ